jgi:glycosyltransferase involved in cell wall biosynthesis
VGFERFFRPLDHWGRFAFYYDYRVRPSVLKTRHVINYSMWESTQVPVDHIVEINRAALLQCVPCRQNAESFRRCGLRIPVKVLHHGVDPTLFPYVSRRHPERFTFGTFGDLSPRKGIDVLIGAFVEEFKPSEPVRLLMKTTTTSQQWAIRDPRVRLVSGFLNQPELLEFLGEMDAFVLPSRGEGFGLCGLEAMSTGLPVIATNWGGPSEYLDPQDSFPLCYRLVDARGVVSNQVRYFGAWAEPDREHLRYLMRWLYEHPAEGAAKGGLAAQRVHSQWTWDRVARDLRDILDTLAD